MVVRYSLGLIVDGGFRPEVEAVMGAADIGNLFVATILLLWLQLSHRH